MRIICNNTGKGNFKPKMEELKKYVIKQPLKPGEDDGGKADRADDNLRWLIHYILSIRLSPLGVALIDIYVGMIRELNDATQQAGYPLSVIGMTLIQAALIFKKCMVINEAAFTKVINVAQGSPAVIKGYLSSLGINISFFPCSYTTRILVCCWWRF